MLDDHVIPPDALYAVSYSSPPPCIPSNWSDYELPSPRPRRASPEKLPEPRLERGKGPWRDPGFWLRLVSPGGTQHFRRRGHSYMDSLKTLSPGGPNKPLGTATLPRGLKYSLSPLTPKRRGLLFGRDNEAFVLSPRPRNLWSKPPLTTLVENSPLQREWAFSGSQSKSATLPRNLKSFRLEGDSPLSPKGTSPPWWHRMLSPLTPRKVGYKQKSPWSEGTIFEWKETKKFTPWKTWTVAERKVGAMLVESPLQVRPNNGGCCERRKQKRYDHLEDSALEQSLMQDKEEAAVRTKSSLNSRPQTKRRIFKSISLGKTSNSPIGTRIEDLGYPTEEETRYRTLSKELKSKSQWPSLGNEVKTERPVHPARQRKSGVALWAWVSRSRNIIVNYAHTFSPPNVNQTGPKTKKSDLSQNTKGNVYSNAKPVPQEKKRFSIERVSKEEEEDNDDDDGGNDPGKPPAGVVFGSRSLETLVVEGSEGKKARGVSLRRPRTRHNSDRPPITSDSNATQSDTEAGKISGPAIRVNNGNMGPEGPLEMSRVGAWATSFEKLIEDPAGLHTFTEFLKKEYSHENIYFWTACERYKRITDDEDRKEVAKAIFDRHLGMAASEPVNVDSYARQKAQEELAHPSELLFAPAQKQIFNLMKFDSYSRFLKSDLYNRCLSQDRKGLPLPYPGDETLDPDLGIFSESQFSKHLKKSKSDAEERRRKSLLPWHRKDRSKSKDRGEAEYWRRKKQGHRTPSDSSSARYDLSDSHTSLSSSDFAPANRAISKESLTSGEGVSLSGNEGLNLCRFILPDQSNSVLAVRSGETVKELVRQLLDRRRINFTDFNVVLTKGNKIVDLNKDSTILAGHDARLERMVLFSLYLPSRKTVIVKAKPHKLISEVLKPILTKYGLKLDLMVIHKYGESKGINIKGPVTDLDGEKLMVQTKEEIKEWSDGGRHSKRNNTLDEITNKVFDDLLNGKAKSNFDDLGVFDFDSRSTKTDPTSETSSSLMGSFSRRESLSLERNLPSRRSGGGIGLLGENPFGAKRNNAPAYNVKTKQENNLYEGPKRAHMSRLDDQRGTEINFELPDFLKSDRSQGATLLSHFDRSFHSSSSDGNEQSEFLSRAHPEVWGSVSSPGGDTTLIAPTDLDLDDLEETLRPIEGEKRLEVNGNNAAKSNSTMTGMTPQSPFLTPPPPLPPKPKLGGPLRGPPPRPPSRQLPPLPHSLHLLDVPIHMTTSRQSLTDKFSVSFV